MGVTDCHVHVNPLHEMRPDVRGMLRNDGPAAEAERYLADPRAFLDYLDRCGVDRAVLVNYVSPEVVGYTERTNDFVLEFVRADPERLVAVGSVLPSHPDPGAEVERLHRAGLRALKIHPPHQLFAPNDYLHGLAGLRAIYAACERLRLPVIVHTGTSVFPRARNRYGHPMLVEDVAIDFPELTIVLAHGGRPFWTAEAMFLARRFPRVYLEVSSVPPGRLLHYFPELPKLAGKILFGSDWPGPGVRDIGENLREFSALPLPAGLVASATTSTPEQVFPRIAGR